MKALTDAGLNGLLVVATPAPYVEVYSDREQSSEYRDRVQNTVQSTGQNTEYGTKTEYRVLSQITESEYRSKIDTQDIVRSQSTESDYRVRVRLQSQIST